MTWKSLTCILGQFGAAKKSADRRGSAVSARPGEIGVARAPPFSTNRRARTGLKSARFNAPFHNDNVRINNESSSSGESADFDFPPWHFDKKFVNVSQYAFSVAFQFDMFHF